MQSEGSEQFVFVKYKSSEGRIWLRSPEHEDSAVILSILQPLQSIEFLPFNLEDLSLTTTQQVLRRFRKEGLQTSLFLVLEKVDTQEVIGMAGMLDYSIAEGHGEAGVFIKQGECRRQGYAIEAVWAICVNGFSYLGLQEIHFKVYTSNKAMKSLLAKLGLTIKEDVRSDELFCTYSYARSLWSQHMENTKQ